MNESDGNNTGAETGLPEIIQLCCQTERSGQVTYYAEQKSGLVYFQHGQVIHATTGGIEGPEAVFQMLAWPAGTYAFDDGVLPNKRTVTLTWEQLLFEGAVRADQGTSASGETFTATISAEPVIATRIQGGQPRITVVEGDQPGRFFEITNEYTHVGRINTNEIVLPYLEISSRHCMFITNGNDVLLRDLNSSNGTFVNGETITESILQLGDIIQIGPVILKFESAVKRPKLRLPGRSNGAAPVAETSLHKKTTPLPKNESRTVADEESYVSGSRPIVYSDLKTPESDKRKTNPLLVLLLVSMIIIIGGAGYILFVLK